MTTHTNAYMQRFEAMQRAIDDIAPWLSASLSDPNMECCDRYKDACDAIFNVDSINNDKWMIEKTTKSTILNFNTQDVSFCPGEN